MPYNFANSALPPYEDTGKRVPDELWRFNRQKSAVRALKLKFEGLSVPEIAREMGVAIRTAYLYLKIGKDAIKSGELTDAKIMELGQISVPVEVQRKRLLGRLRKTDEVIGQALDDYGKGKDYAQNATRTALAINKGVGVLTDKIVIAPDEDVLAKLRGDQQARFDALKQFGVKVDAEVVDSDDSPIDVTRETSD